MSATKLLAGVLSVAFAITPLVLDRCEASCDAARTGAAVQVPSCHQHAPSLTAHAFSRRDAGCGHDHLGGLNASSENRHQPNHAARIETITNAAIAITGRLLERASTNASPPQRRPLKTSLRI